MRNLIVKVAINCICIVKGSFAAANKLNIIFLPCVGASPFPKPQKLKWRLYLHINMRSLHFGNHRRNIIILDIQKTKCSTYTEKVNYAQFMDNSLVIDVAMFRNIWLFLLHQGGFVTQFGHSEAYIFGTIVIIWQIVGNLHQADVVIE